MINKILEFFQGLDSYQAAIGLAAVIFPILGFLLKKFVFKEEVVINSTKMKMKQNQSERDTIQAVDVKVDNSVHNYHKAEDFSPSLAINKHRQNQYMQLQILNNGNEALVELSIKINGSKREIKFINID